MSLICFMQFEIIQTQKRTPYSKTGEVANMAKTIEELDITAKGEAMMLMVAVTRFTVRRSGTLSKSGSGKWKHDATNNRSFMDV